MNTSNTESEDYKLRVDSVSGVYRFSHEAMATIFEVLIIHPDVVYAEQAANAAFDEVDKLESELSRFIENSDVSQINNLGANQALRVSPATFECLEICGRLHSETEGAFDVTVGALYDCLVDSGKKAREVSASELETVRKRTGMELVKLDEDAYTVKVSGEGVQIDFGGFGKGYAVDKMTELLVDWGIERALIHGGFSSVLALEGPTGMTGWPVTLSNPLNRRENLEVIHLSNQALSSSGLEKGQHIIDPRKGEVVGGKIGTWVCGGEAGTCDGLSTAFMVMSKDEIERYCQNHPETAVMVMFREGIENKGAEVLRFGDWEGEKG
jgi:thiamine biosynthesis lipoprotein